MDNWIKKDLKYIWHPYTQMKDCEALPPLLIEKAKGIKLYDAGGNFYYDTISSWWCNVHGHNHPKIKAAIKKQLDSLEHVLFAGFTHKPAIILAEKLVSITPKSLTKVFFSDNGSTAVETALKMSFQYRQITGQKQKTGFISLENGYHGDTLGAMSVSGVEQFNKMFSPLLFKSFKVPCPYCYRCPMKKQRTDCDIDCLRLLEKQLKENSNRITAMILEPMVMAAGGMIVYPKRYLKKTAAMLKKYNVHLIVDEVATGFGRTGRMFACEHAGIEPDFMCLSKGITAGYLPLAATLTTEKIYSAFYDDYEKGKTFFHGHTYTANPLACAAAIASLRVFAEEDTIDRVNKIIPLLRRELERFRKLKYVGDIRSIGMIAVLELVRDKKSKRPFPAKNRIEFEIYKKALARGLLLRPLGNVIYLFLPLCIKQKELETILDRCYEIIADIKS
jgi:adenosylmethionine-8-amino-7-oxononanoate aminotransferase